MPGAPGGDPKPAFDDYNGAALAEALNMLGVDIRYDIRAHREQYRRGSGQWEHLTDNHEAKLRDQLATRFHIRKARSVGPFWFSGEKLEGKPTEPRSHGARSTRSSSGSMS